MALEVCSNFIIYAWISYVFLFYHNIFQLYEQQKNSLDNLKYVGIELRA